jgi:hypothetical protein
MTLGEIFAGLEAHREACQWRKDRSGAIVGEYPKGATASALVALWRIKNGRAGPYFPGNAPDPGILAAMELGLSKHQAETLAMACNTSGPYRDRILEACGLPADE